MAALREFEEVVAVPADIEETTVLAQDFKSASVYQSFILLTFLA